MNLIELIKSCQRAVKEDADGKPGIKTWTAIAKRLGVTTAPAQVTLPINDAGRVDARSEKNIATLLPHVQPYARALVQKAAALGITIKVISGSRDKAEQTALYAQGRSAPGPKVTNAPYGYSNHNFGIAFDIGVFQGTKYLGESPLYKAVGALGVELGLEWGGNWKSIVDQPHFQLRPSWAKDMTEKAMLAELRSGRSA